MKSFSVCLFILLSCQKQVIEPKPPMTEQGIETKKEADRTMAQNIVDGLINLHRIDVRVTVKLTAPGRLQIEGDAIDHMTISQFITKV